jgi:sialidase-1
LRPDGWDNGLDYTLEPVRKRMLDFITEVLDRYDPEGLELDLMRFPFYLPRGREKECAPIFTAYMRELRKVVNAAAAKRGHPMTLSVRLKSRPSGSRELGMEADVWAKEGIVDVIVPTSPFGSFDFDIPLAEWRTWTGDKVQIYPSADEAITENGKRRIATFEEYRRWSSIMYERGAKGLYLFNFYMHPQDGAVWNGVLSGGLAPQASLQSAEASKPTGKITQELLNSSRIAPKLIFDPMPAYGQKYLSFAMAASMESTHKGRRWTCWAGGQDGPNAYLLASYSDDQGTSWRDPVFVIDPQAQGLEMGTRLGSFWCDPKGRLWLFFHQSVGMFDGSCSNWFVRCDNPDAEKPVWTEPVYIGFGASLNKPVVRKNGEWILPVSLWERWHIDKPFADCYHELDAVRGSNVFVSDDEGGHWSYRGGNIFKNSCFNEHSVVEKQDGSLWMLSRCMKEIAQSFSKDGGKTWQAQTTFFPQVNSKAVFRRLKSGHLLLIKHGATFNTPAKDSSEAWNWGKGRSYLTAFLSTDDGKTWPSSLLLDERSPVSYPDIAQTPNGDICVHYDRDRTGAAEILFARFREEDVQAGKLVSQDAALENLVKSKLGMNHGSGTATSPK